MTMNAGKFPEFLKQIPAEDPAYFLFFWECSQSCLMNGLDKNFGVHSDLISKNPAGRTALLAYGTLKNILAFAYL